MTQKMFLFHSYTHSLIHSYTHIPIYPYTHSPLLFTKPPDNVRQAAVSGFFFIVALKYQAFKLIRIISKYDTVAGCHIPEHSVINNSRFLMPSCKTKHLMVSC